MTNNEFVSEVIGDLRARSVDMPISKEYVLNKGRDIAQRLIGQDGGARTYSREASLYTTINCLALEPRPIADCCDFVIPGVHVARSCKPLPETLVSGKDILRVFTIDGFKEFVHTTAHEFQYTLHRTFKNPKKGYFWLQDGYLVIPNEDISKVRVSGMFIEPMKAKRLEETAAPVLKDSRGFCLGPLDDRFVCPSKLLAVVRQETVKDLYSFLMKAVQIEDQMPDHNVHSKK